MIKTGLQNFIENIDKYKNRRTALIANQTSVTSGLEYSWDALSGKGLELVRIFCPEHGLFAVEQDQVAVNADSNSSIEIVSLYGSDSDSLIPDPGMLDDIDLVLFDIQDIGTRYYTYVNTMAMFMEAIQGRDIEFMVLDRPNPVNGKDVEGPGLNPEYRSFVGVFDVPVRHGMTAGELALLHKKKSKLDINLNICIMQGWERKMRYRDTGLFWVPPSPNMPDEYTALLYPGMCLVEGSNLSEGRGTTLPFVYVGADYVKSCEFADKLNSLKLPGVHFRPVQFKPVFNKYSGKTIHGVYIHVLDEHKYKPFYTGVALIKTAYDMYRPDFRFSEGVYEFNDKHPAFDLLTGDSFIRDMIVLGSRLEDIQHVWLADQKNHLEFRKEFLLY